MTKYNENNSLLHIFIFALIGAGLFIGLYVLNSRLTDRVIQKHESEFNNQQFLETALAASAFDEALHGFVAESNILSRYSFAEYLRGHRSEQSINNLLKIEFATHDNTILHSLYTSPGKPLLLGISPDLHDSIPKKLADDWSRQYLNDPELEAGNSVIPPPYARPDGQFIGCILPVMIEGKLKGITIGIFDLAPMIRKYISPMRAGKYGAGYLLSEDGTVLYDHEQEIIGRNVFDGMHEKHPDLLALDRRLISEDSGKSEYTFTVQRNGQVSRKLIAWNSLSLGPRKIIICRSAPDLEIDSALKETRLLQNISTGLSVLLVVGFAFLIFRRETARRIQINEERLEAALEGNRDGVWDWNLKTGEAYHSPRWKEILGYSSADEITDENLWKNSLHPDDVPSAMNIMERHMNGESPFMEAEFRIKCRDGNWKWVLSRGKTVEYSADNKPVRIIGTLTDISDRKNAEAQILRLSQAVENCMSPVVITDADCLIEYVNRSFTRVSGYTPDDVRGKSPDMLRSSKEDPKIHMEIYETLQAGNSWSGEIINTTKDGRDIWLRVSISPIFDDMKQILGFVGTQEDITALKEKEYELARLADTDELTGIYNRRRLLEAAEREYRRVLRHPSPTAFIIFDIDHFKEVNDTYGHSAGDAVLKGVANTVASAIREIDVFGRIGGEEFALVLPRTELKEAVAISERIRRSVENAIYRSGNTAIQVTAGFGVSGFYATSPVDMGQLFKEADKALYRSKETGRNKVVCFAEMEECTDDRSRLFRKSSQ